MQNVSEETVGSFYHILEWPYDINGQEPLSNDGCPLFIQKIIVNL